MKYKSANAVAHNGKNVREQKTRAKADMLTDVCNKVWLAYSDRQAKQNKLIHTNRSNTFSHTHTHINMQLANLTKMHGSVKEESFRQLAVAEVICHPPFC